jgi:hypothetical protein
MKVPKERMKLCDEFTNSHKTEARIRRQKEIERQLDMIFMYALLFAMVVTFVITLVDVWGKL